MRRDAANHLFRRRLEISNGCREGGLVVDGRGSLQDDLGVAH